METKKLRFVKQLLTFMLGIALWGSSYLSFAQTFKNIVNVQVGDEAAAEIVTYSKATQTIWVLNSPNNSVDCYDFKNPEAPVFLQKYDYSADSTSATSVAAFGNYIAIALKATITQDSGKVVVVNAKNAAIIKEFQAGPLPDMVTFSHDGTKIIVANEGEPNAAYDNDPEGSITIINISNGIESAIIKHANFQAYNNKKAYLRGIGVRIQENAGQTVAQDLEPEYIAVAENDSIAFVTLQENNAVAKVNINTAKVIDILPLGYKDYQTGTPSLKTYALNNAENWPELGTPIYGKNVPPVLLGGFSGLCQVSSTIVEQTTFWAIPDRGPNDAPVKGVEGSVGALRPYKLPDYQARMVKFTLNHKTGKIAFDPNEQVMLFAKDGVTPITGKANVKGKDEVPVTYVDAEADADYTVNGLFYKELAYDPYGGDFEGIVIDKNGDFWMCDENRPGIYHFSSKGVLIERYVPNGVSKLGTTAQDSGYYGAETLPANYNNRRSNRGFEGIAYDWDKHTIYAFIQSAMYNPGSAAKNSDVIRILGIDANNGAPLSEYVYLLERNANPGTVTSVTDKIGDACFVENGKFVVIERDSKGAGDLGSKKYIYEIDLLGATNIIKDSIARLATGNTLELMTADQIVAAGIQPVFKRKIVNLPSIGYLPSDKAEGLAVLPDGKLAVINDNDFGLAGAGTTDNTVLGIVSFNDDNVLAASDKANNIELKHQPVLGAFMPDAIASYTVNGLTYFVTANEGDGREYGDFADETRVGKLKLNTKRFKNTDKLQSNEELGRLKSIACPTWDDLDNDGKIDNIFALGGRSFSIFDEYGNLVYDSGSDIVKNILKYSPQASHVYKNRADDKGSEPEALKIVKINGKTKAFIGLERINGFMIYDITNPSAVKFEQYINDFDFYTEKGNQSPEGFEFIAAEDSPNGKDIFVAGYETSGSMGIYSNENLSVEKTFMVISDVHYFDPSLLINDGLAFQTYLAQDRKMLKESHAIVRSTIEIIKTNKPDFILVSGDLTKDGEKSSHDSLAVFFTELETAGIDVYVVPGNHDINNPHAVSFDGDNTKPVAHVTPSEFKTIYNKFGFDEATNSDSSSLSYTVDLGNYLLLAIDACQYNNNIELETPVTAGAFKPSTIAWVKDRLAEAKLANKQVVSLMHHGMVEQYKMHGQFFGEYIVNDWQNISTELADAGMTTVFTGHSHAQNITRKVTPKGNVLHDIQTGSLVTYPCPIRKVTLMDDNTMVIDGMKVENVKLNGVDDFQAYAKDYLESGFPTLAKYMLMQGFGIDEATATFLAQPITRAFLAHYYGDEQNPSKEDEAIIEMLKESGDANSMLFGMFISSLWTDLPVNDWFTTIDLLKKYPETLYHFTVFHNNDGESKLVNAGSGIENFGGIARFKTLLDSLSSSTPGEHMLLSSGDNFLAGPQFNAGLNNKEGIFDAIGMSRLGYDAICLGNHDFDFGPDVLKQFINNFESQIPFLSSNLSYENEQGLDSLKKAGRIASSTIITKGDLKIGVIGATTPALNYISSPRNVTISEAIADSINAQVEILMNQGINKIVLISHLQNIQEDTALIKSLKNIDIVIAGGGDELLGSDTNVVFSGDLPFAGDYPLQITDADNKTVYIVTTPGEYKYIGKLDLQFNYDGEVVSIGEKSGLYLVSDAIAADSALLVDVVNPIDTALADYASNIIANSEVQLNGLRNSVRYVETNLGDLIADAMLWQANQLSSNFRVNTPNIAFVNGGGIRNNSIIEAGAISELNTFEILPFSNFVSVVEEIEPEALKELLENSVSAQKGGLNSGSGRFLQVAGMKIEWDTTATSIEYNNEGNIINDNHGDRIWSIILDNNTVIVENGIVKKDAPNVNLSTTNFTAGGGDQFNFKDYSYTTLGVTYQQALYNFLEVGLSGQILAADYPESGMGRIVEIIPPALFSVTFNVSDGSNPVDNAMVIFNNDTLLTNENGLVVFSSQNPVNNAAYRVIKDAYHNMEGTLTIIDKDVIIDVALTAVGVKEKLALLSLYPNPANSTLNINLNTNGSLTLYSLNGQIVWYQALETGKNVIDINALKSSMYIYIISNQDGSIQGKLVVE